MCILSPCHTYIQFIWQHSKLNWNSAVYALIFQFTFTSYWLSKLTFYFVCFLILQYVFVRQLLLSMECTVYYYYCKLSCVALPVTTVDTNTTHRCYRCQKLLHVVRSDKLSGYRRGLDSIAPVVLPLPLLPLLSFVLPPSLAHLWLCSHLSRLTLIPKDVSITNRKAMLSPLNADGTVWLSPGSDTHAHAHTHTEAQERVNPQ